MLPIIQISKSPIAPANYFEEGVFDEHDFTNNFADYVTGSNRNEDITHLKRMFEAMPVEVVFGSDENGEFFVLNDTFKKAYFKPMYEKFKTVLFELAGLPLDDFIGGEVGVKIQELRNAYNDKFSLYFYEDDEMSSFDTFIRMADENAKYYIGGTLLYHM